jgi:Cd2+/Zn2+-exporting ATPase
MLTGDNERVAESIARRLGIEHAAQLLPEDKLRAVKRLRDQHRRVAMVGDGVNDAPSMAASDLAIAIAGTDVALETADAVLMGNDLRKLPAALAHARRAQSIIYQNLIFAFTVMLVLLTLTLFFTLPMPFAVIGHEGSTVLVIVNGLRLIRLKSL